MLCITSISALVAKEDTKTWLDMCSMGKALLVFMKAQEMQITLAIVCHCLEVQWAHNQTLLMVVVLITITMYRNVSVRYVLSVNLIRNTVLIEILYHYQNQLVCHK